MSLCSGVFLAQGGFFGPFFLKFDVGRLLIRIIFWKGPRVLRKNITGCKIKN